VGASAGEIAAMLERVKKARTEKGRLVQKTERERLTEAKRKLRYRKASESGPRYSLHAPQLFLDLS
jgi:hypothetical protein